MVFEPLSASDRDAVCSALLRERLEPLGLTQIAPRRWIDGSNPPARRLFELHLLKGASLKACWGFSLDFVPHLSGGSFRWHRSDKAARLDVIVDPAVMPQPCSLYGAEKFRAECSSLLAQAAPAAERDWARVATFTGMLDIIREIREANSNCHRYPNYTQLPLACMFLAAKVGDVGLAQRELEQYLEGDRLGERESEKLRRLVRECAPDAQGERVGGCAESRSRSESVRSLPEAAMSDRVKAPALRPSSKAGGHILRVSRS